MRIYFFGGAGEVTGSMHMIEVNGKRILMDCGFHQGHREEANRLNRNLPFAPRNVDVMLLSHAHIDHSGNIPNLVKSGFKGSIYCTHATRDLASIMLQDAGHIQEKDAEYVNKKQEKKGLPPIEPATVVHRAMLAGAEAFGCPTGWADAAATKTTLEERRRLVQFLSEELREPVERMLLEGRRIPEEVVGPVELRIALDSRPLR